MNPIFLDAKLQDAFDRDGFVVLDDLVSEEEIARSRDVIAGLMESHHGGATSGGILGRARRAISGRLKTRGQPAPSDRLLGEESFYTHSLVAGSGELLTYGDPIFQRAYRRHLSVEYKTTFISCMIRVGNESTRCHNHPSNMPFPRAYPQIILHIQLQDMDASSGPMTFVKGSHKPWENRTQVAEVERMDYTDVFDQLKHRTVSVCTRKGQGILFSNYILHLASKHSDPDWRRFSIWGNAIPASCDVVKFTANVDAQGNATSLNQQGIGESDGAEPLLIDPCEHLPVTKAELLAFMKRLD